MRRRRRQWGRTGCLLEIMLAVLFSLVHLMAAWRVSALWPGVMALPPQAPARVLFTMYWWPPMRLLNLMDSPRQGPMPGLVGNLMLMPLSWLTCLAYGWLTSLAICLPIRFLRRRR